jgi:hypothetical protein
MYAYYGAIIILIIVKYEVFTAVTMKNAVFSDAAPCKYCVNRRFGGMYNFHFQIIKVRERETSVNRWLQPPGIFDLDNSWSWVISFTPRPLYPKWNGNGYPLDRRLGGVQNRSGQREKRKTCSYRDSISYSSAVRPVANYYTDWAIPASDILLVRLKRETLKHALRQRSLAEIWKQDLLNLRIASPWRSSWNIEIVGTFRCCSSDI